MHCSNSDIFYFYHKYSYYKTNTLCQEIHWALCTCQVLRKLHCNRENTYHIEQINNILGSIYHLGLSMFLLFFNHSWGSRGLFYSRLYTVGLKIVLCHHSNEVFIKMLNIFADDGVTYKETHFSTLFIVSVRAFPSDYDSDLYKLHLEAMFKGLLVHLDDPSTSIQVV